MIICDAEINCRYRKFVAGSQDPMCCGVHKKEKCGVESPSTISVTDPAPKFRVTNSKKPTKYGKIAAGVTS
jgi:hypothetical protein